jgi:hypothetical protein
VVLALEVSTVPRKVAVVEVMSVGAAPETNADCGSVVKVLVEPLEVPPEFVAEIR